MRIVADLHLHSKYSRATSADMDVTGIAKWAKVKGIGLVGTGDFTHPDYLGELKRKLKPLGNGLFEYDGVLFILSAEVSNIFDQGGLKKIHHVLFSPSFEIAEQINERLAKHGNLKADGRPTFGRMSAAELVELVMGVSKENMVVPAHAWTPWFSVFGANSGFDSIDDCYGDMKKHIHALETGLSCYDNETDILTESGWKKIPDVKMSDKICTINKVNNEITYQYPINVFRYPYKGKMYRLKTKRVDILVTPNHNLFYSPCDFRNQKPYALREARELFGKSKRFKKDGIWRGKEPEYFTLPSVKIRHGSRHYSGERIEPEKKLAVVPWLKFFGFWLAEGWTTKGKDGDYNVCVCNKNKRLLSEMKRILNGFGYNVFMNGHNLRVRDYQLFDYLKQFGNSREKHVPKEIKSLAKELLEIMFHYYILGDGHRYGRTGAGLSATTISIRLRDDLQEIALKMGISAYYKLGYKKGHPFSSPGQKGKIYRQSADSWIIFFIRRNRPIILPSTVKKYHYTETWEDYDGEVFCVSVPNHVIYIRRNGIPLWCGNSDPAMNWRLSSLDKYSLISNSDAHSPRKLGREANVFELERVGYDELMGAIRTKDQKRFRLTYEFYPEEGKYHFDGHRGCGIRLSPTESRKYGDVCPVCRKPLTIGVMHRVEELADREPGFVPKDSIPFENLVPLEEIISGALGKGTGTKGVTEEYWKLIKKFGNELAVLHAEEKEIEKISGERIAKGIVNVRVGKVRVLPGYDGVYGEVDVFGEKKVKKRDAKQSSLGDFG